MFGLTIKDLFIKKNGCTKENVRTVAKHLLKNEIDIGMVCKMTRLTKEEVVNLKMNL